MGKGKGIKGKGEGKVGTLSAPVSQRNDDD